jgi:hypothetical protein
LEKSAPPFIRVDEKRWSQASVKKRERSSRSPASPSLGIPKKTDRRAKNKRRRY